MGRGGLRGSAHLGLKSSSDRRYRGLVIEGLLQVVPQLVKLKVRRGGLSASSHVARAPLARGPTWPIIPKALSKLDVPGTPVLIQLPRWGAMA